MRSRFYEWKCLFLTQIQLLPLILFAPFLVFPEYFPSIVTVSLAGFLALFTVGFAFKRGRRFLAFYTLLLPYPLLAALSYWASADKLLTTPKLYLFLTAIATLVLVGASREAFRPGVSSKNDREGRSTSSTPQDSTICQQEFFSWIYVLMMLGIGLMGPFITQFRWTSKFLDFRGLGATVFQTGEILDINLYGCLMAISVPVVLGLALTRSPKSARTAARRERLIRFSLWLAVGIFVVLLILSQARAGLVALTAGLAVFLLLSWKRGWVLVFAGAAALSTGFWFLGLETIQQFLAQSGSLESLEGRQELWSRSVYAIQDSPFTGIGAGMFNRVIPLLYPLFLVAPDATQFHSHNLYLQVALDLGIGGLVAFTSLVGLSLSCGIRARRFLLLTGVDSSFQSWRRGQCSSPLLIVGHLSAVTVFLVSGTLDSPLWMNKPMAVPFLLMGILIGSGGVAPRTSQNGAARTSDRPPARRFWLNGGVLFILWLFVSFVAISLVGDHPYWGLAIAIAGGLYLGWEASRSIETVTCR